MSSIKERQNSSMNLNRLAAQRQLYSEAKNLGCIQFVISGLAVIIFAIIGNLLDETYTVYITLALIVCVLFDELFLTKRIDCFRLKAATIQEDFDCEVLQIPHNHLKNRHESTMECIQENSKKYLRKHNNYELLTNWYPGVESVDESYGKILCQSTNCWWNQNLREKYSNVLISGTVAIFIILLLIALIEGITLSDFIMSVIYPILPGTILVYKINSENKKAIQNLDHLKSKIDDIIVKLKRKELYDNVQLQNDIRFLQDMIFDNRSTSPLVPDKIYFKYRNNDEETAKASNMELVELLKNKYE